MQKYIIKLAFFISLVLLGACSDDNDDFTGTDSIIASFELVKDGDTYIASITDNRISIVVPENISLNGASAKVTMSENATIVPDPATIKDWDNVYRFRVSSYNKTSKEYVYQPEYTPIAREGDVFLYTQADVDNFFTSEKVPSVINGSLIIGKNLGFSAEDSITNLDQLKKLHEVKYAIQIKPTVACNNIHFDNLLRVGDFSVKNNTRNVSFKFPKLESMTSLVIENTKIKDLPLTKLSIIEKNFTVTNSAIKNLELSLLNNIGGDFIINRIDSLTEVSLPLIRNIGGVLTIQERLNANDVNGIITKISMPSLSEIGGTSTIKFCPNTKSLDLDNVMEINGGLTIQNLGIEQLKVSNITKINGLFSILMCNKLQILSMPSLTYTKNFTPTSGNNLVSMKFNALETIDGSFTMTNTNCPNLTKVELPALKKVTAGMAFTVGAISSEYTLEEINMPVLEEIGGKLDIKGTSTGNNKSLKVLNFTSLKKAGSISMTYLALMKDYSSFKNVIPSLSATTWSIKNCRYSPTYQNMVEGKYTEN